MAQAAIPPAIKAVVKNTIADYFLKSPLYTKIAESADGCKVMTRALLSFEETMDAYCPGCGKHSTFRPLVSDSTTNRLYQQRHGNSSITWEDPWFEKTLQCTRQGHLFRTYFVRQDDVLIKVGQYPSIADLEKPETAKFAKILGEERRKELNRAIGLAANGVGVGSYVYLRRIFESFVEEAHEAARSDTNWNEDLYIKSRMAERVQLLKDHLPAFLHENPKLYSVLSLGLHELTEEQCLKNYDAVLLCITVILEERLEAEAKLERAKAARKMLAKIST